MGKILITVFALFLVPFTASAQLPDWSPERLELTRTDLEALIEELRLVEASSAYSDNLRNQAKENITRIEQRLRDGDFSVGDAVILHVDGEEQLSDTIPVEPGPRINLPELGGIPLTGVLRSELQDYLTTSLSRFINDPQVRARSMIRLSIQGQVSRPGYYVVPAEVLIGEALMMAGGPGLEAEIDELRVERGQRIVWDGTALQDEVAAGRTLDQLGLLAGDQLFLPRRTAPTGGWWERGAMIIGVVSGLILSVDIITR